MSNDNGKLTQWAFAKMLGRTESFCVNLASISLVLSARMCTDSNLHFSIHIRCCESIDFLCSTMKKVLKMKRGKYRPRKMTELLFFHSKRKNTIIFNGPLLRHRNESER